MSKTDELKKDLWRITEAYAIAKENFNYCYYLHQPKTDSELKYVNLDRHLKVIRHSLWRLTIIELSKLFSNRVTDKFNLYRFIPKLSNHYRTIIPSNLQTEEWNHLLEANNDTIQDVIKLRDNIYAHTHLGKEQYRNVDLSFEDINKLFEIVGIVIKQVNLLVLEREYDLRTPVFDREDFDILKVLANAHEKEIESILTWKKS